MSIIQYKLPLPNLLLLLLLLLHCQATAYAYNDAFSRVLQQRMHYFSTDPSADVINRVRGEITQVCVCLRVWGRGPGGAGMGIGEGLGGGEGRGCPLWDISFLLAGAATV